MSDGLKTLKQIKTRRLDKATRALTNARRALEQKMQDLDQAQREWQASCEAEREKSCALMQAAQGGISRHALDVMRWELQQRRTQALEKQETLVRTENDKDEAEQTCEQARHDFKQKTVQLEKVGSLHAQHSRVVQRRKEQREESSVEESFQQRYGLRRG
jgi:hypothetical protein